MRVSLGRPTIRLALVAVFVAALSIGWRSPGVSFGVAFAAQAVPAEARAFLPTAASGVQFAVVNFADLAAQERAAAAALPPAPVIGIIPEEGEYEERETPVDREAMARAPGTAARDVTATSDAPSPSPTLSYQGLDDIAAVGSGFSYIPPDTEGAVGLTRVFTTLNNNYRVLDKATGTTINTVSMATFWSSVGALSGVFDPKTKYDPYNNRFVVAAVANAQSTSSKVLFGVSQTSDPNGAWFLYGIPACSANCGTGTDWWADYPELGFNVNWLAVSVNMFTNAGGSFTESRLFVADYAAVLAGGAPTVNAFTGLNDFTIVPVVTYSNAVTTLYAPTHLVSSSATYRLNTITGSAASPVYTQGAIKTHTLLTGWAAASALGPDALPQAPEPGTSLVHGIDEGDSRIMNAVYRNGSIWYAQSIALPCNVSMGACSTTPTHSAAQWVRLDTSANDVDAGRIEDPTATSSNGGKWYAYPSISVNAADDALLGFSQFSSAQFPSAAYAFRPNTNAPGVFNDVVVSQSGIGFYYKTYLGARNRWGDYSATQVDPSDDSALWTLQELSKAPVGTGNGSGRWNTWWVKIVPPAAGSPPPMPSGLGATTVNNTRIDLSWTASAGATSYNVKRGTSPGGESLLASGIGGTTYSDTTVSDGMQYFYVVSAVNAFGESGNSNEVSGGCTYTLSPTSVSVPAIGASRSSSVTTGSSCAWTGSTPSGWISFTTGSGTGSGTLAFNVASNSGIVTRTATITLANRTLTVVQAGAPAAGDLDGDGLGDLSVWHPGGTAQWQNLFSIGNYSSSASYNLGTTGDQAFVADFDGDKKADLAVWRPSTGQWQYLHSNTNFTTTFTRNWGMNGDVPVPGDYDGDGKADLAVWRPSTGQWYVLLSSTNNTSYMLTNWGTNGDVPVPGDYDGDGKADLAVWRPSTGQWFVLLSSTNNTSYMLTNWGTSGDVPVAGDYDGDGRSDIAVWRPSTRQWYIRYSSTNYTTYTVVLWGTTGDIAVPADYDGDGKADIAIWRPSTGDWYILKSTTNFATHFHTVWGTNGDTPALHRP